MKRLLKLLRRTASLFPPFLLPIFFIVDTEKSAAIDCGTVIQNAAAHQFDMELKHIFQLADGRSVDPNPAWYYASYFGIPQYEPVAISEKERAEIDEDGRLSVKDKLSISHVDYDPESGLFLARSRKGFTRIWHIATGIVAGEYNFDDHHLNDKPDVNDMWLADGGQAVVAGISFRTHHHYFQATRHWLLENGQPFPAQQGPAGRMATGATRLGRPNGNIIAVKTPNTPSIREDSIQLWDFTKANSIVTFTFPKTHANSDLIYGIFKFDPSLTYFLAYARGRPYLKVFDQTKALVAEMSQADLNRIAPVGIEILNNGIAMIVGKKAFVRWNFIKSKIESEVLIQDGQNLQFEKVIFGPNGNNVVLRFHHGELLFDRVIRAGVWNFATGKKIMEVSSIKTDQFTSEIGTFRIHPSGRFLIGFQDDWKLQAWHLPSGDIVAVNSIQMGEMFGKENFFMSPDGRFILVKKSILHDAWFLYEIKTGAP